MWTPWRPLFLWNHMEYNTLLESGMLHYFLILSLNYYRKSTFQVEFQCGFQHWMIEKKNVQTKYFSQMFCFKRYLCFVATYLNSIFRELKSSIMYQKNVQLKIIAIHKFAETCPSAIICGMKIGNVQNAVKEIDAITMLL